MDWLVAQAGAGRAAGLCFGVAVLVLWGLLELSVWQQKRKGGR